MSLPEPDIHGVSADRQRRGVSEFDVSLIAQMPLAERPFE